MCVFKQFPSLKNTCKHNSIPATSVLSSLADNVFGGNSVNTRRAFKTALNITYVQNAAQGGSKED